MTTTFVLVLYAAVAALVTSYTFYHAIVLRARPTVFSFTDDAILLITTLFVGATWVLFIPGLTVAAAVHTGRHIAARPRSWAIQWPSQLRAR